MMREDIAESIVDGNAVAGLLSGLFAGDPTTMEGRCGGCGRRAMLADAVVELDDTAAIIRCRGCTHTLVTVIQDAAGLRLVLGALRELGRGVSPAAG